MKLHFSVAPLSVALVESSDASNTNDRISTLPDSSRAWSPSCTRKSSILCAKLFVRRPSVAIHLSAEKCAAAYIPTRQLLFFM